MSHRLTQEQSEPREQQAATRQQRADARIRSREQALIPAGRALIVDSAAATRRNALAVQLQSFYEFLTTMYLPTSCIKRPPKEVGWPSITAERLAFMEKTDTVVDLLKHIPYISQDVEETYQIQEKCVCNDYTGKYFERAAVGFQDQHSMDPLPESMIEDVWDRFKEPQHIVTLAQSATGDAGWHIFYDTRDGQLALVETIDGTCVTYDNPKEYFDAAKDGFRELTIFPTEPTDVRASSRGPFGEEEVASIKEIFKKHRWPAAAYKKQPCMKEVLALWNSFFEK